MIRCCCGCDCGCGCGGGICGGGGCTEGGSAWIGGGGDTESVLWLVYCDLSKPGIFSITTSKFLWRRRDRSSLDKVTGEGLSGGASRYASESGISFSSAGGVSSFSSTVGASADVAEA